MTLPAFGKLVAIAFVAAFTSWLPVAIFFTVTSLGTEGAGGLPEFLFIIFPIALLGSFAIGLPVALLTFWLARKPLLETPAVLVPITILAVVMMMIASFAIGEREVMLLFGVPSAIAALTYAALGWRWLLVPIREASDQ